jgi:hypothetical protein
LQVEDPQYTNNHYKETTKQVNKDKHHHSNTEFHQSTHNQGTMLIVVIRLQIIILSWVLLHRSLGLDFKR